MDYKEFEKSVDLLELCSKSSLHDLKIKYKELSKLYHPDMPGGNQEKFIELTKSYKMVKSYMEKFRYTLEEEEFKEQFPFFIDQKNWF